MQRHSTEDFFCYGTNTEYCLGSRNKLINVWSLSSIAKRFDSKRISQSLLFYPTNLMANVDLFMWIDKVLFNFRQFIWEIIHEIFGWAVCH